MKSNYFIYLLGLILLISCEKKEKSITLPPKGDGNVMQVDMGGTYEFQYFIKLSEQRIVHVSKIDSWDLAFQSGSNERHVFLNGGKGMAAYNTNKTNFEDVNYSDTLSAKTAWSYDSPTGSPDSSAIGNWESMHKIYLIKLNESGTKVRKLQIVSADPFQYVIAVGDIASTVPATITVVKNASTNFTYFSFDLLTTLDNIEPPKESWDLQFTRYNYTFFDQASPLRYVVTGVLLNPNGTMAYKDSVTDYNSIKDNFATSVPLSPQRDVIGWDWKLYSGIGSGGGNYSIVQKYNYIIKDQNNHYFKFHFLDFYSAQGVVGSPKFEFYQLK